MNIVICGAGEIGSHAAEKLDARDRSITVIDLDLDRLARIEDALDVGTLAGSCAHPEILRQAGCASADLVLAATDRDETNLLAAATAKALGAKRTVARVHSGAFFLQRALNYSTSIGVDRLICPEHAAARAIARRLRSPGATAIETFARDKVHLQEFTAGEKGDALNRRLADVRMPSGTRLLLIRRKDEAFVPGATSVVVPGDSVVLVGNTDRFDDARKLYQGEKPARKRIVIMGGPAMAVWLCRELQDRSFAVRLFEKDRAKAEALADKLDWVTVINADPTDRGVFDEEGLGSADVFISLVESDETNIIAGVLARARGVDEVITVVQQAKYLDIVYDIGVDRALSTREEAVAELEQMLDDRELRHVTNLAEGKVDAWRVRVQSKSAVVGQSLRTLDLPEGFVIAALDRGGDAFVPGGDDELAADDAVLVVGAAGRDKELRALFGG